MTGSGRESRREHWDRFWRERPLEEIYESVGEVHREILRHCDPSGARVLEVGAGSGRDSLRLAERGAAVTVLDYSLPALASTQLAQSGTDAPRLVRGDALQLPFPDASFDVVFHQGLLEHFRDPAPLLAENARVLAPGGFLLVDVPQRWHYYTPIKKLLIALGRWFAGWECSFSARELEGLVRHCGLEVTCSYGSWPEPGLPYRALRQWLIRLGLGRLPMRPRPLPIVGTGWRRLLATLRYRRLGQYSAMVVGTVARKPPLRGEAA